MSHHHGPALATHVGIDVGALGAKGFHAVALRGAEVMAVFRSHDPDAVAHWVVAQGAAVVAIDAPCRWRAPVGLARAAERQLAAAGIACFLTPTEEKARDHPFYLWMHAGQALYAALAHSHPLFTGGRRRRDVAIETFPQAVACALAGARVPARDKVAVRGALLREAGISVAPLRTVDEIDAALCALAAREFAADRFHAYGDTTDGCIIVPAHAPLDARRSGARPARVGVRLRSARNVS